MEENPQKESFEKEAAYISEESPEISVGQSPLINKFFSFFPAFTVANYRLYFSGQLISVIGTWLQIVAQGWLVLQLTHSALMVGLVAALANIPSFFFSLFGGVIVDRFPKKHIVLFTQASSMILAFILGLLTILKVITVFEIGLLAFLLGVVNAIDWPARQSFVPEFVGKERLASAIAINSGIYNSARVVGPAVAGILIALIGTGGAFMLNGLSYIAVILALLAMKVELYVPKEKLHPVLAIKEGLMYAFNHSTIRALLIFVGVSSIFAWSYTTILPVITQYTFHLGATGLGYLYVAGGLGAVTATIIVSAFSQKISPVIRIFGGNTLFAVSIFLFTLTHNFMLALLFLFLAGFGLLFQFATMNTTIQTLATRELRGRVLSIYALMFIGLAPVGSFEVGFLSDRFGTAPAIQLGALIVCVFGTILFINRKKILGDLHLKTTSVTGD
jgi:MFS family permease